jgi:hypothetical protein
MDWGMFAAITGVIALQTMLLLWMMSKLDSDIKTVSADLKAVALDSNAKWMAVNARSDSLQSALNARVDTTQVIIMRMLEKQGK